MSERINKILNVTSREWPRIIVAWSMMFLVRFGFIVGWTILMATFLSRTGIENLPILFLTNAILVMGGALVFRRIIHKVKIELLISLTALSAIAFILLAMFFIYSSTYLFFIFLLIGEAVLLSQLNILLSLFNEDLFSPLESQRTFPIIDSAETIGGIAGGLLLTFFANSIPSYKYLLIWALSLLLILPIVLKFNSRTMETPSIPEDIEVEPEKLSIGQSITKLRKVPFLKGLMLVILLQWAIMNVVEFQYTKAIQQEVYQEQEQTIIFNQSEDEIMLASQVTPETENYEHKLTQKLGALHMIFNAGALFIQLILASRIIVSLGITSSLLLHPIVTLLNVIGLTLRFGFFTAAMTRGNFEMTQNIFKNAYHSSYYAIEHKERAEIKEVMEGFMKPLGAILGTIFVALLFSQYHGIYQSLSINLAIFAMVILMILATAKLTKNYTRMSEKNLSKKMDLPTRLNAVEILAQNGHGKLTPALAKILKRKNEPDVLKIAIIKTLGKRQDLEYIGSILEMLSHDSDKIRLAAINALSNFENLKKKLMNQSFTRFEVIETLKTAIQKEKNEYIREKIVKTFYQFAPDQVVAFLINSIKSDKKYRVSFIRMFKLFHDPNIKHFLSKYLKDKNPDIRGSAIIALWQFKNQRSELEHHLKQMLESSKSEILEIGIEVAGLTKFTKAKATIRKHVEHPEAAIKNASIMALAQMEDEKIIPNMISAFTDNTHEWSLKTTYIIESLPKRFKEKVNYSLHLHISHMISGILMGCNKPLKQLEIETLHLLNGLYEKIGAHHETHKIQKILASRTKEKI